MEGDFQVIVRAHASLIKIFAGIKPVTGLYYNAVTRPTVGL